MNNKLSNIIKNEFYNQNKKFIFLLIPIIISSYLIKIYYFESGIGLTFDSLGYFFYAVDITILGHLPENYTLANNFWSIILSLFFTSFEFENTIQYMDLQKNISIIISTLTIIPIYFLARKFFSSKYSIIAAIIFAFEPRLIQNSILGITEPLYILFGVLTLLFFLSSNKKIIYFSFLFAGLVTITRGEGQILFFIISIMFFIRFRKEKLVIPKYLIGLGIFLLILIPMMEYQIETQGNDSTFGRAIITIAHHTQDENETDGESGAPFFIRGIENFTKFFGWDLIPLFILFVPIGIFYLFKKPDFKKITLILAGIGMSIPAFYAYSIPLPDTRYLFILYPIFCIISLFAIKKYSYYLKNENILLIIIIIGIIFSSIIFLETKTTNGFDKYEIYEIMKIIVQEPKVMNSFYPEDSYLEPAIYPEKWNNFKNLISNTRMEEGNIRNLISNPIVIISTNENNSIEEFIKNNNKLTHIITDQNENRPKFLKDIFENENKYEFLIKEFDSKDLGYNYHIKVFKIDK